MTSPLVAPEPPEWEDQWLDKAELGGFEANEVRRIVTDLSRDAKVDEVELALFELLPQIYRAANRDLPVIGEILSGLREKPGTVAALASHFVQIPAHEYEKKIVVISMLGELQRFDALEPLREVIWETLPSAESMPEGLSERDLQEMIQAKAIHGLAYLKTPTAKEAVREVIVNHESLHVRVSAIDAYMWNHGDNRETADELYSLLPAEMHMYVERPRFHRDMDPEEFSRRLSTWREKWAKEPETTPELDAGHVGGSK